MKVIINENCINCGHCYMEVDTAGLVFVKGDAVAKIKEGADFAANIEMVNKAVDECPVAAIEIIEDAPVAPAGVPVENTSEPEIPVESAPEAPASEPSPSTAPAPEMGSATVMRDDLAVSSEPITTPAPEAPVAPVDDEIPLG